MTVLEPVVLVVDDDEEDRLLLREAFEDAGLECELREAQDGRSLFELLRAEEGPDTPGLILLDLNLAGTDGGAVLRALKQDPSLQRIPVAMLSTSANCDDVWRSYADGAAGYLVKPASAARFAELARGLYDYWFKCVELPPPAGGAH